MKLFLSLLLVSNTATAAIYGPDNRLDISKVSPRWQTAAQAVAVALPSFYLEELDDEHLIHSEHGERPYGKELGLCKDEKFYNQKSFGHCSAFLIHPKLLVTAGHCFLPAGEVKNEKHDYCDNFSFWLNYNDRFQQIPLLGAIIPKKNVVHCKKVIYATNNQEWEPHKKPLDFALIELEEEVTHIKPLKTSVRELVPGERIATIGHPQGLPAKFSGLSPLISNNQTNLTSFMDTLSGNSGGPVFNIAAEVIGVLIAGHQYDTYEDKEKGCDHINTCDENGLNCNMGSELDNSNLLIKSQVWQPYVEDYLAKPSS